MNLLRLAATLPLLAFLLPAQGVTEVIPQSLAAIDISADGRFVFHWSSISPSGLGVYDSATGVTTSVPTIPGNGGQYPEFPRAFSGNGQVVAVAASFGPTLPLIAQVYVIDMATGSIELVSKNSSGVAGNNPSYGPSLSDDGRFVAFHSWASNLVIGDTNGTPDVFVHDRVTHVTTRVSANGTYQATGASSQAAISGDGNWILYLTNDLTLTGCPYCLYDRTTGVNTCASGPYCPTSNSSGLQQISRNGQYITHASWVGGNCFTHVKNLWTGSSTVETILPDGTLVGATGIVLSPDGGFLYFEASVGPFYPFSKRRYLRDIAAGVTHVVNVDSGGVIHGDPCVIIYTPQGSLVIYCNLAGGGVSDYGRHLTFHSYSVLAPGAVPSAWNTYLHHRTPHVGTPASVPQGSSASLVLSAIEHPGKSYVVGLSTGYAPGILVDWRWAPLVPGDLLTYSLTPGAPYLVGFQGTLDASGNGAASIQVPVAPGLSGASFYAAFAVLDASAASGIAAFSNAALTVIQ